MQELVTEAAYRRTTKDFTSSQADVLGAMDDAVRLIESRLGRELAKRERTEQLPIIDGQAMYVHTPVEAESRRHTDPFERNQQGSVTYVGGWTQDTLPFDLREAIIRVAAASLSSMSQMIPEGATSLHTGDVSVGFSAPRESTPLSTSIWSSIKKYRHRSLMMF